MRFQSQESNPIKKNLRQISELNGGTVCTGLRQFKRERTESWCLGSHSSVGDASYSCSKRAAASATPPAPCGAAIAAPPARVSARTGKPRREASAASA